MAVLPQPCHHCIHYRTLYAPKLDCGAKRFRARWTALHSLLLRFQLFGAGYIPFSATCALHAVSMTGRVRRRCAAAEPVAR